MTKYINNDIFSQVDFLLAESLIIAMSKDKKFKTLILESVSEYIDVLSETEKGTIYANVESMEAGDFESVYTKQLRGKIRELIVGKHRFIYFLIPPHIYFVSSFIKKTNKTLKREITNAENIFKQVHKK